jgi:hypothetical protein
MSANIAKEVAALGRLTVKDLRAKHLEVFGEATRSGNKDWLRKRIAWRIQANASGDLSERARRRADELANDADLRTTSRGREVQGQLCVRGGSRGEESVRQTPDGFARLTDAVVRLKAAANRRETPSAPHTTASAVKRVR